MFHQKDVEMFATNLFVVSIFIEVVSLVFIDITLSKYEHIIIRSGK